MTVFMRGLITAVVISSGAFALCGAWNTPGGAAMTRSSASRTSTMALARDPQQVRFEERVDVARVLVDVRVTDGRGRPIRGLTLEEFRVEVDGRPTRLESATWIGLPGDLPPDRLHADTALRASSRSRHGASREGGQGSDESAGAGARPGRIIVFVFQHSLEPTRISGLLRMMRESARFVERLAPADRAAVVVFDSRLRLWLDFTGDRARLSEVMGRGILSGVPSAGESDEISLAASLDPARAAGASSFEEALGVLGDALRSIEGAKSVVIFGHGFGEYRPGPGPTGIAVLGREYERAREALVAARATVFALDVTNADAHTLESGLMAAADDTGGFYARTHQFYGSAMDRLDGALQGYYLLAVEVSTAKKGRHTIRVHTTAPGAAVAARRYYVD